MDKLLKILPFIFLLLSCGDKDKIPETATTGTVKVAFDESFQSIVEQESEVFQFLYKYATVIKRKAPQEKAHQLLIEDSVKLIYSSRPLSEKENLYFKSRNVYPKTYEFAEESLVLIVNKNNPDSSVSIPELKKKVQTGQNDGFLVVDHAQGSSLQALLNLLRLPKEGIRNIFSADSIGGVIQYVAENKSATGVIPGSWVMDAESRKSLEIRNRVRILKVSLEQDGTAYYPFQSEVADSLYPLISKIYIISRESKMGMPNGYASFVLGEKGQRIVLKAGLVPARIPGREVVFTKKDILKE